MAIAFDTKPLPFIHAIDSVETPDIYIEEKDELILNQLFLGSHQFIFKFATLQCWNEKIIF